MRYHALPIPQELTCWLHQIKSEHCFTPMAEATRPGVYGQHGTNMTTSIPPTSATSCHPPWSSGAGCGVKRDRSTCASSSMIRWPRSGRHHQWHEKNLVEKQWAELFIIVRFQAILHGISKDVTFKRANFLVYLIQIDRPDLGSSTIGIARPKRSSLKGLSKDMFQTQLVMLTGSRHAECVCVLVHHWLVSRV